jgi:predicted YcjX-like family ATPase
MPPRVISRVAFAATKADHVADRQRGNLAALMRSLTEMPGSAVKTGHFAIASVRCTEDFVWTLEGRPVSAVRGRVLGQQVMTRSYPGEVPDRPPDEDFWAHRFLALPQFEPMRLPDGGRMGVPNIGLDALLGFLLEDVL